MFKVFPWHEDKCGCDTMDLNFNYKLEIKQEKKGKGKRSIANLTSKE